MADLRMDTGEGWRTLILDLAADLDRMLPGWEPLQIKEKFGGLRFYYSLPAGTPHELTEAIAERVAAAEVAAYSTCEVCGQPGTLRKDLRWMRTLCDTDAAERS